MRRAAVAVLCLAAGGCAVPATSDDPYRDLPRRSLADVCESLPEPSVERAFVFDGTSPNSGPIRRIRLAVEAGEYAGEPAWFVTQQIDEQDAPDGPTVARRSTTWLSSDLRILSQKSSPSTETAADPASDGTQTLAGALILLRECPARACAFVAAPPRDAPPFCLHVALVDADGTIHAAAPTNDAYHAAFTLRGPGRTPVAIECTLGWHRMGDVVASPAGVR